MPTLGLAGDLACLQRVYRSTPSCWRPMLSSRSQKSTVIGVTFQRIQTRFPLRRPKVYIPYEALSRYAIW